MNALLTKGLILDGVWRIEEIYYNPKKNRPKRIKIVNIYNKMELYIGEKYCRAVAKGEKEISKLISFRLKKGQNTTYGTNKKI